MPGHPPSEWDEQWGVQAYVSAEDEAGHKGIGEGLLASGIPPEAVTTLVNDFLSPAIRGRELNVTALNELMLKAIFSAGLGGISSIAISGIDVSLWDLLGKSEGKPLSRLLQEEGRMLDVSKIAGSEFRVPVYASFPRYGSCDLAMRAVEEAVKRGYTAIKLHQSISSTLDCVKSIREKFPKLKVAVDLNCSLDLEDALQQLPKMQDYGIEWFEEPLWPPDDFKGIRRLVEEGFPIAAGEDEFRPNGFEELCTAGVKYVQPDVAKSGGITGFLRALDVAERYDIKVAAHVRPHASYVNAAATLGVSLASPLVSWVEFPPFEFSGELFTNTPAIRDGMAIVKEAPGIGTEYKLLSYAYRKKLRALKFADLG